MILIFSAVHRAKLFAYKVVNTVNFSNHAGAPNFCFRSSLCSTLTYSKGYGRSGGSKTAAAELTTIFESMELNELLVPKRLLTGQMRPV